MKRKNDLVKLAARGPLIWVSVTIIVMLALSLVGCPGVSVAASCRRHPDGTVECGIDGHRHPEK